MSEWQPIETAPKDGRSILTCIAGYAPSLVKWVDYEGKACWSIDPETFMDIDHFEEYYFGSIYSPTHWMLLPPPPKIGDE